MDYYVPSYILKSVYVINYACPDLGYTISKQTGPLCCVDMARINILKNLPEWQKNDDNS